MPLAVKLRLYGQAIAAEFRFLGAYRVNCVGSPYAPDVDDDRTALGRDTYMRVSEALERRTMRRLVKGV